eukprot:7579371-Lingulodinium_polyedra.AAC.1
MAARMEAVGQLPDELSAEERSLLNVAFKNAVGSRRAAWRSIADAEQEEMGKGNEEQAQHAWEYCTQVVHELTEICDVLLGLLDGSLIAKATTNESKVFYLKMKADCYRYIAEVSDGDAMSKAANEASLAYVEASKAACEGLEVTHPVRLGLALNYSVFQYE